MVGCDSLKVVILVRIQAPQQKRSVTKTVGYLCKGCPMCMELPNGTIYKCNHDGQGVQRRRAREGVCHRSKRVLSIKP